MTIKEDVLNHILNFTALFNQAPHVDDKDQIAFWKGINYHDVKDHLLSISWKESEPYVRFNPYANPFDKNDAFLRFTVDGYCNYHNLTLSELDTDELEKPVLDMYGKGLNDS